jgi:soluble lytic murein transglycosylase-like protein
MARIPVYQERQQISQLSQISEARVPDSGAGLIGRSMQQVGQALGQVANTVGAIQDRQARIWATETAANEMVHWSQRSEELKATAGKGGAGYFEALNKEYEERANTILAQAPNKMSRQYLSQNFLTTRQNLLTNAIQFEVVEGRAAEANSFKESTDKFAFVVARTKDPQLALSNLGQLEAQIDASNLLPRQKEEAKKYAQATISTAYGNAVAHDDPSLAVEILSRGVPAVKSEKQRESLYLAVQAVESSNNPKAVGPETRYGRAIGLMQVLPSTAMAPGVRLEDGSMMPNIFQLARSKGVSFGEQTEATAAELLKNPEVGQKFGRMYLDAMLARYNGDVVKALAGYNWGIRNVDSWDGDMSKLPEQTRNYIPNVLNRAGLTGANAGAPTDSILAMMPLGNQLKLLETARQNQTAQIVESASTAVYRQYGPQSDTDPIQLDLMNDHIDVLMAGRPVAERNMAKTLIKQYADAHKASANQRQAERVSGTWEQVLNGAPMSEIIASDQWKALDGQTKAQLIGQINSFRTQPTQPAQWAAYEEIKSNPAKLASMSPEQILAMAPMLGNELTTKLIQDRSKLNTPEGLAEVKYDEDSFKVFASKAGLKVFDSKIGPVEKEKIGQFRYAVETAIDVRQAQLKRPLSRAEQEEVMAEVLNDKVFIDQFGKDPQQILSLVSKDNMGNAYVTVGEKQVYVQDIDMDTRKIISDGLRAAGMPVTEVTIAEIWLREKERNNEPLPKRKPREIDPTGFGAVIQ